jgi:hypothetical protein
MSDNDARIESLRQSLDRINTLTNELRALREPEPDNVVGIVGRERTGSAWDTAVERRNRRNAQRVAKERAEANKNVIKGVKK